MQCASILFIFLLALVYWFLHQPDTSFSILLSIVRFSSKFKRARRTIRVIRSSFVAAARERRTTANASVSVPKTRISISLQSTVLSFVSPTARSFARLRTLLSTETAFLLLPNLPSSLVMDSRLVSRTTLLPTALVSWLLVVFCKRLA